MALAVIDFQNSGSMTYINITLSDLPTSVSEPLHNKMFPIPTEQDLELAFNLIKSLVRKQMSCDLTTQSGGF